MQPDQRTRGSPPGSTRPQNHGHPAPPARGYAPAHAEPAGLRRQRADGRPRRAARRPRVGLDRARRRAVAAVRGAQRGAGGFLAVPGRPGANRAAGSMSCQYALILLRWIHRAPEDFLTGPVVEVGDVRLPHAGPDSRLRWDLGQVHAALDGRRRERRLTWAELAEELDCTPSRLTNLRTARLADMDLTMRVTQWLGHPAARFVHPTRW